MRFQFCPQTGELSVYASDSEFQLAVRKAGNRNEYRVIQRTLMTKDGKPDDKGILLFLKEYIHFVTKILADLHPDEKIKDIVVFSTMPSIGYLWTSLLDLSVYDDSQNFMEMVLSYALRAVQDTGESKHAYVYQNLMELLSERDFSKVTLIKMLMSSMEHPAVWKVKRKKFNEGKRNVRLALLNKRVDRLEKKYQISTREMLEHVGDYPAKDAKAWTDSFEEVKYIELTQQKFALVEKLTTEWADSF